MADDRKTGPSRKAKAARIKIVLRAPLVKSNKTVARTERLFCQLVKKVLSWDAVYASPVQGEVASEGEPEGLLQ